MPTEVIILLTMALVAGCAYWQLVPFFPKFLKGKGIDQVYVGYSMSSFAMGQILFSYMTGKYILACLKRITGCFLGAILIVVNLLGMGSLKFLDHKLTIMVLSLLF